MFPNVHTGLPCLDLFYFISRLSFLKNAQRIFHCRWVILLVVKHHPQRWRKLPYISTPKEASDLHSVPVCHILWIYYVASQLEFQRCLEKSFQISFPFWNFPQLEACVDCLINLLHVGNTVSFDEKASSLSSFWSPCYKVMVEGLECFCCSEIVLCYLSMQLPFPAYLL